MNIIKRKENLDLQYINTTVSPSNNSSIRVFEKLATELKTKIISKSFFEKEDFINAHEEETLYEIGPFKLKEK
jgi:L-2,4-diaminobutyric acid acetyltransferase